MSVRPNDSVKPPTPPALRRWPKAPGGFSKYESTAWDVIGAAAMHLGTMSEADLLIAGRLAQVRARVDDLLEDTELKASTLASMLKLEMDLYKQLGLSPQARRQVAPLKSGKKEKTGFEDVD